MVSPNELILPGDKVDIPVTDHSKCVLGPGLHKQDDSIISTKAGILRSRNKNTYWVEAHQKRYVPAKGDCVIGIVTAKAGDNFRVNIGSSEQGSLSVFAFEGATKRSRPDVQVGDLVFTQVLSSCRDMEPELVCVNSYGRKGMLGVLRSPTSFWMRVPIDLVNRLLSKDCPLLRSLGQHIPFEISLGQNGRVWVNANTLANTLAVCDAISSAENLTMEQIKRRWEQSSKG
ncbi:exosome complex component RRP40-like [Ornithodoros turicata]